MVIEITFRKRRVLDFENNIEHFVFLIEKDIYKDFMMTTQECIYANIIFFLLRQYGRKKKHFKTFKT